MKFIAPHFVVLLVFTSLLYAFDRDKDAPGANPPSPSSYLIKNIRELVKQQQANGSWIEDTGYKFNELFLPAAQQKSSVEATALAAIALLEVEPWLLSHEKKTHRKNVTLAVNYLINCQKPDGFIGANNSRMIGHAYATVLLAQYYRATGEMRVRRSLVMATEFILDSQSHEGGGWFYAPQTYSSNIGVTYPVISALYQAHQAKALGANNWEKTKQFLERIYRNERFMYSPLDFSSNQIYNVYFALGAGTYSTFRQLVPSFSLAKNDKTIIRQNLQEFLNEADFYRFYSIYGVYATLATAHREGLVQRLSYLNHIQDYLQQNDSYMALERPISVRAFKARCWLFFISHRSKAKAKEWPVTIKGMSFRELKSLAEKEPEKKQKINQEIEKSFARFLPLYYDGETWTNPKFTEQQLSTKYSTKNPLKVDINKTILNQPIFQAKWQKKRVDLVYNETQKGNPHIRPVVHNEFIYLHTGDTISAYKLSSQKLIWQKRFHQKPFLNYVEASSVYQVVPDGENIYATVFSSSALQNEVSIRLGYLAQNSIPQFQIARMNSQTGEILQHYNHPELSYASNPIIKDGIIYTAAHSLDVKVNCYLVAIEQKSGKIIWKTLVHRDNTERNFFGYPARGLIVSDLVVENDSILFTTQLGALAKVSIEGKIQWIMKYPRAKLPKPNHQGFFATSYRNNSYNQYPMTTENFVIFAPVDGTSIYVLNNKGEIVWKKEIFQGRVLHHDQEYLWVGTQRSITKYKLATGKNTDRYTFLYGLETSGHMVLLGTKVIFYPQGYYDKPSVISINNLAKVQSLSSTLNSPALQDLHVTGNYIVATQPDKVSIFEIQKAKVLEKIEENTPKKIEEEKDKDIKENTEEKIEGGTSEKAENEIIEKTIKKE